jgi:CBS domain-containing protein
LEYRSRRTGLIVPRKKAKKRVSTSTDNTASTTPAGAVLTPVIEFLVRHAPFDRMAAAHLEFLAKRLKLGFYTKGEVLTEPGRGPAQAFYIIKQGRVRGESDDDRGPSEDGAWELVAGECFPIGALLARRAVRTLHRAVEDTFCFELEREDFERVLALSPVFHDFCSRRLANLLDQALRHAQANLATEVSGDASLSAPLANLTRRAPVSCVASTPIRAALATMNTERIGSMMVTDTGQRPLGVFTLHDLLSRVVTAGTSLEAPIESVMTRHVYSLPPQATAHEAAVLMARQGIGHVCVVEDERLIGVVSERDLFSLQRIGLVNLSRAITHAPDVPTLAQLGHDIHRLIDQMLVQGASVPQISQIIALLNDHVTRRVIELVLAETGSPSVSFTWLSFGSEGRQEQTLKTDQDNGILFVLPAGKSADAVRAELLPVAKRINDALDVCGYPLCTGNIMASNPACCLSFEEWKRRFENWIEHGAPEHLLNATIFFDFRALWGNASPAEELRHRVTALAADTPRFLRQMAENAMRNQPPLGLVREFVLESEGEHANQIDLKLRGTKPFVDGARLIALAHRLDETNTLARLRAAARAGVLRAHEAEAWCDAFGFIQLLRMRAHQAQARTGRALDNHIDPDSVNDLDRRILKEAFRQARKLQTRIRLDYQL